MNTTHKEKVIFEAKDKAVFVFTDNVMPKDIIGEIHHIQNNKENVYVFNSGDSAEFLYERSCVNDISFNYLQLYNESSYKCLKKIKNNLRKICEKRDIDLEKNMFFITSEYETNLLHDFVYDCGGYGETSFCGYWFLQTSDESYILVNNEKYDVREGDIIMFESNAKIQFHNISKSISFNISNLSKIRGQYPQKWMPLILS